VNPSNQRSASPGALRARGRNSDGPDWGDPAELNVSNEIGKRLTNMMRSGPDPGGKSVPDLTVPVTLPPNFLESSVCRGPTAEEINSAMESGARAHPHGRRSRHQRPTASTEPLSTSKIAAFQFLSLLVRERAKPFPDPLPAA